MNLIILFAVFATFFICIGIFLLLFRRKNKNKYNVDENAKYSEKIYQTFIKNIPAMFILAGIVLIAILIKAILN
ncbi:hypothetical protein HUN03_00311 [Mycoplasmopsis anatis]|uniref:Uncharacterized protein n=2 Tax=Mycoplasmopsis anatis TaxID=171279 RepID=F9QCE7_9BACT|nr:hypothetical protein [Mycoplasmopsis anatis]AWX69943.1 hypothetical protein DP067_00960 [Mycoplasmopsis anatis]EGS29580.1 hypothetical protein GIG_00065 [Mycoplasmopsis anatis 1340]MBW0595197.1 hypothetical protein [Mycoplasmopsis anatis]MBW0595896.1 hypothetical protein [Mycoplasmopsis anatis]MBW0596769.1 hypothetical protein [Mycoplasmopsis anatis]